MILFDKMVEQAAWPQLFQLSWAVDTVGCNSTRQGNPSNPGSPIKTTSLCKALPDRVMTGASRYQDALVQLRGIRAARVRASLATILTLNKNPPPERTEVLSKLCEDFGLVAMWRRKLSKDAYALRTLNPFSLLQRLRPLSFVLRAEAAENLGVIRHLHSWRTLVDALDDPSGPVQSAAKPAALPGLVNLRALRPWRTGWNLPLKIRAPRLRCGRRRWRSPASPLYKRHVCASWSNNVHPDVRLAASDFVGLMVQRESAEKSNGGFDTSDLSPELAEIFLARLTVDEDPDVRARVIDVVAHLEPYRATPFLTSLLGDPTWFVRLRCGRSATRDLARYCFLPSGSLIPTTAGKPQH
jgi:hypothetical protein